MSAAEFTCKKGRVEFSWKQSRENRFSSWICKHKALKVWEGSECLVSMHGEWPGLGTGECCFGVSYSKTGAWGQTEEEEEIGCSNFGGGVGENQVSYLDVSGFIPESGSKDNKVHESVYCFVFLCILMWFEAKKKNLFGDPWKKKNIYIKKSSFTLTVPCLQGQGAKFTQAGSGGVSLHKMLPENAATWGWPNRSHFAVAKTGGLLVLPLLPASCCCLFSALTLVLTRPLESSFVSLSRPKALWSWFFFFISSPPPALDESFDGVMERNWEVKEEAAKC